MSNQNTKWKDPTRKGNWAFCKYRDWIGAIFLGDVPLAGPPAQLALWMEEVCGVPIRAEDIKPNIHLPWSSGLGFVYDLPPLNHL